jgi:flagellar basal body-associated protein FliL
MATKQEQHKQSDIGRRLMWILLAVIAVIVVAVLFFYGITDPSKGPGNVPASGAVTPAQKNASPANSR